MFIENGQCQRILISGLQSKENVLLSLSHNAQYWVVNWVWNAPWKAISILNFLWWYILRWVSNVFILPSVPGSCHDYSSIAHTHLQVHGNPYHKEDFITIWVTQPVQRFYPKKMMQRSDHEIQINPLGFSMHFSIEEKRNIFIIFTNWNSSVWSRSKPKCCLPSYIWWEKKKKFNELHTVVEKVFWWKACNKVLL